MIAALVVTTALALPAGTVYVDDVVALDDELVDEGARDRVAQGADLAADEVVVGRAALYARTDDAMPGANPRAAALLKAGEDMLLTFEYARAAAALAECAAVVEADLAPADVDTLTRARLLEAEAWVEAGDKNAAKDAVHALLVVRPDVAPDEKLLSPAAMSLFTESAATVRADKSGELEVRTSPAGAEVVVDGAVRGTSPVTLIGLARGTHKVRLRSLGYTAAVADVVVGTERAVHEVTLVPSAARRALDDASRAAAAGAPGGAVVDELRAVARDAKLDAIVLVAVRTVDGKRTVLTRRIDAALQLAANEPLFAPAVASASSAPPPPAAGDDGSGLLVWGAVGAGVLVVTAGVVVGTIALWPKPAPPPALGVVLQL